MKSVSGFLKNINKFDKPIARKKKEKTQIMKIRNEMTIIFIEMKKDYENTMYNCIFKN